MTAQREISLLTVLSALLVFVPGIAIAQQKGAPPTGDLGRRAQYKLTATERANLELQSMQIEAAVRNKRYFYLGANGEFIFRTLDTIRHGTLLVVLPKNDSFGILTTKRIGNIGAGDIFAEVSKDGIITIKCDEKTRSTFPCLPSAWPVLQKESALKMPAAGTILSSEAEKEETLMEPPPGATAWVMIEPGGELSVPKPGTPAPPNVLWYVPKDGGFQLIHSGPLKNGVFMTVDEDRYITLSEDALNYCPPTHHTRYWTFVRSQAGKFTPVMTNPGFSANICGGGKDTIAIVVDEGPPAYRMPPIQ